MFECPLCHFIGDHRRILKDLRLKQEGEALLRRFQGESMLIIDGLQNLRTRGNELPLERAIKAVQSVSSQSNVPTMETGHIPRMKYARTLALIEIGAFADWFISNLGSLSEGKLPVLQAAFPFMFLFSGAFLLYVTAK